MTNSITSQGFKNKLTNKIFKLLPLREEGQNYTLAIEELIKEVEAMRKVSSLELFFTIQYKLELLKEKEDFSEYRKMVFEILNDIKEDEGNV